MEKRPIQMDDLEGYQNLRKVCAHPETNTSHFAPARKAGLKRKETNSSSNHPFSGANYMI